METLYDIGDKVYFINRNRTMIESTRISEIRITVSSKTSEPEIMYYDDQGQSFLEKHLRKTIEEFKSKPYKFNITEKRNAVTKNHQFHFSSQPCTSIEQNKRLSKLGLKKETADMYLFEYEPGKYKVIAESWNKVIADIDYFARNETCCTPAWSFDRLREMYMNGGNHSKFVCREDSYERLIDRIEEDIKLKKFNPLFLN